jgi:hypothetical protein
MSTFAFPTSKRLLTPKLATALHEKFRIPVNYPPSSSACQKTFPNERRSKIGPQNGLAANVQSMIQSRMRIQSDRARNAISPRLLGAFHAVYVVLRWDVFRDRICLPTQENAAEQSREPERRSQADLKWTILGRRPVTAVVRSLKPEE